MYKVKGKYNWTQHLFNSHKQNDWDIERFWRFGQNLAFLTFSYGLPTDIAVWVTYSTYFAGAKESTLYITDHIWPIIGVEIILIHNDLGKNQAIEIPNELQLYLIFLTSLDEIRIIVWYLLMPFATEKSKLLAFNCVYHMII